MSTPRDGERLDPRHQTVREQVGAYALDQLPGGERLAVASHLRECARCREELDLLRALAGPLAEVDPDDIPHPRDPTTDPYAPTAEGFAALRERIRAEQADAAADAAADPAVDGSPYTAAPGTNVVPLRPRRPWRRAVLAAAAAAMVFVLGAGAGALMGPGLGSNEPFEPVAVQALTPDIDASAGVVPHTWGVEVRLTASGFRPGETYRATVRDGAGRTVSAGEFIGTGAAEMVCNLNSSILREDATGFSVTDEAGRTVLVSSI